MTLGGGQHGRNGVTRGRIPGLLFFIYLLKYSTFKFKYVNVNTQYLNKY